MQGFHLISAILRGVWAIDQQEAMASGPIIARLLKGESVDFPQQQAATVLVGANGVLASGADLSYADAPAGSIAVIDVQGALRKADGWCSEGMESMARRVRDADAAENIVGIVLRVDSPGGTVDGTEGLANAISATSKPTLAWVSGMAASAAYWISSAADEIYTAGKTDTIGSIGTMISFADMRPYWEKEGIKFHEIFASASSDKNRTYLNALKGDYTSIIQEVLDPTNNIFLAAVRENRPGVAEETLTGKTFLTEKAEAFGLIEGMKSFDEVLTRVRQLAEKQNQNNMFGTSFKGLKAIAEAEKNNAVITREAIIAANEELAAAGISTAQLVLAEEQQTLISAEEQQRQELAAAQERISQMEQDSLAREERIAELEAEVAELGAADGATPAKPKLEGSEPIPGTSANNEDDFEHNRAADQYV